MVARARVGFFGCFVACSGSTESPGLARVPATAAPVAPTEAARPEDISPCDPAEGALARAFDGIPTRTARRGGCGVQVEAPLRPDSSPEAAIREVYPGWTDVRAMAGDGPEGRRFTLQHGEVQCTTVFAWGPQGPAAPVPWSARVDCGRRPG